MKQIQIHPMFFVCAVLTAVLSVTTDAQNMYENCSANYTVLENALLETSNNKFKLSTTFFNPNVTNPTYVTVTYNFTDSNETAKYIWSAASIYLIVPPQPLHYLSLFFGYWDENSTASVTLQLPVDCKKLMNISNSAEYSFLYVLTQRLRVYAKHYHSMNTMILPDGFEARVVPDKEREHMFVDNDGTKIFFSFVLVFPIIALFTFGCYVGGTCDYITKCLNDSKYHPSQAALVCTGQAITAFCVYMDIRALATKELINFMMGIIITLVSFEIGLFLLITISIFIILCCKNSTSDRAKTCFIIASLIPPLISLSSHIGFIVVGWASFTAHGTAIMFFYSFVVIYYFLLFQKMYSCFAFRLKSKDFHFGILLIEMTIGMIILLLVIAYIFEGFRKLYLVRGVDNLATHAFSFGQYVVLFVPFLLTYIIVNKGETQDEEKEEETHARREMDET